MRSFVSSPSATGNGEGSKNGVAGAEMFFINSPANIREGMRANVSSDRRAQLRKMTSLSFALHASRVGMVDKYSDQSPPDQAEDDQLKSESTTRKLYEPLKKTRAV